MKVASTAIRSYQDPEKILKTSKKSFVMQRIRAVS